MVLILQWFVNAIALLLVGHYVPGFHVQSFGYALIAVLVIGLLNATVGLMLKIITFPLSILTLGLFLFVINALILMFAGKIVPGFEVQGFTAALIGAVALALISMLFHMITKSLRRSVTYRQDH
jgi:putative membrane protein